MNWLELIASILGIISVWFVVQRNIWAFPVGIVMVGMYFFIFYEAKYYGDMVLQVVFVVMQVHGWYEWSRGDRADDDRISVQKLAPQQWLLTGGLLVVGTLGIGYLLQRFTDAALLWVDALTTTLSLLAQWWMNKKYLDNWTLWIIADAIYLYQYAYKALYFTTVLYAVFLVLAVVGLREWRQKWAERQRSVVQ